MMQRIRIQPTVTRAASSSRLLGPDVPGVTGSAKDGGPELVESKIGVVGGGVDRHVGPGVVHLADTPGDGVDGGE